MLLTLLETAFVQGECFSVKAPQAENINVWGDAGVEGRIILRWIFRKWDVGVWTGSSWLTIGTGGGHS